MYLLFSRKNGIMNKCIEFLTWSEYAHVDLMFIHPSSKLTYNEVKEYVENVSKTNIDPMFNGVFLFTALPIVGVCIQNLNDRILDSTEIACYEVIPLAKTNKEYFNIASSMTIMLLGAKYDWAALVGMIFRKDSWDDPRKWFCSEYVAYVLDRLGIPILQHLTKLNRVTPRDLSISPILDLKFDVNIKK